jgi:outer membrane protein assembly factor BamB
MLIFHGVVAYFSFALSIAAALVLCGCTTTETQMQTGGVTIDPSIIAVSTPGTQVQQGASFAWVENAINVYKDERLDSTTIQYLIERSIKTNLADMGFKFVESEAVADYTIAYTAALESSLDDNTILRRYGLVPGNMRVPQDNPDYEKGTLLIYAFDAGTGDMVWRSAVQAAVDFSLDEQARKQRIGPIIKDMFRTLPTAGNKF